MVAGARRSLIVLAAAVGLVLLIACANLANLLLAAGAGRASASSPCAPRSARSGGSLIAQLLAESLVLSAARRASPDWRSPRGARAAPRCWPRPPFRAPPTFASTALVLAFVALTAVVAAVLFGLAPAAAPVGDVAARCAQGRRTHAGPRRAAAGARSASSARRWRWPWCCSWARRCSCAACGSCRTCRRGSRRRRSPPWTCRCQWRAIPRAIRFPFYERLQERVARAARRRTASAP